MMRALLCGLLLLQPLQALASASSWNFRVYLDNRPIGEHHFTLRTVGERQELHSNAHFDVRFLLINVFRYRHSATESWQDNCLRALSSETETNGKRQQVHAEYPDCIMSFAYWNPQILRAQQLLNSQSGVLTPVSIALIGTEGITVRDQRRSARRYHIAGPQLAIDVWYANDEWVALESATEGGRRLRYQLL
jgi:Family of unknown function (DUF6134)